MGFKQKALPKKSAFCLVLEFMVMCAKRDLLVWWVSAAGVSELHLFVQVKDGRTGLVLNSAVSEASSRYGYKDNCPAQEN